MDKAISGFLLLVVPESYFIHYIVLRLGISQNEAVQRNSPCYKLSQLSSVPISLQRLNASHAVWSSWSGQLSIVSRSAAFNPNPPLPFPKLMRVFLSQAMGVSVIVAKKKMKILGSYWTTYLQARCHDDRLSMGSSITGDEKMNLAQNSYMLYLYNRHCLYCIHRQY